MQPKATMPAAKQHRADLCIVGKFILIRIIIAQKI
jgi:hypothetical protein